MKSIKVIKKILVLLLQCIAGTEILLFNMNGLLRLMLTGTDPFLIGCILIFAPFFILYRIYELASFESRKETV